MGRNRESVLAQSASARRSLTIKVDPAVEEELKRLKDRLKREAPTKDFDVAAVITPGLLRSIRAAHAELDALAGARPATIADGSGTAGG
jgi:hypothetical protein